MGRKKKNEKKQRFNYLPDYIRKRYNIRPGQPKHKKEPSLYIYDKKLKKPLGYRKIDWKHGADYTVIKNVAEWESRQNEQKKGRYKKEEKEKAVMRYVKDVYNPHLKRKDIRTKKQFRSIVTKAKNLPDLKKAFKPSRVHKAIPTTLKELRFDTKEISKELIKPFVYDEGLLNMLVDQQEKWKHRIYVRALVKGDVYNNKGQKSRAGVPLCSFEDHGKSPREIAQLYWDVLRDGIQISSGDPYTDYFSDGSGGSMQTGVHGETFTNQFAGTAWNHIHWIQGKTNIFRPYDIREITDTELVLEFIPEGARTGEIPTEDAEYHHKKIHRGIDALEKAIEYQDKLNQSKANKEGYERYEEAMKKQDTGEDIDLEGYDRHKDKARKEADDTYDKLEKLNVWKKEEDKMEEYEKSMVKASRKRETAIQDRANIEQAFAEAEERTARKEKEANQKRLEARAEQARKKSERSEKARRISEKLKDKLIREGETEYDRKKLKEEAKLIRNREFLNKEEGDFVRKALTKKELGQGPGPAKHWEITKEIKDEATKAYNLERMEKKRRQAREDADKIRAKRAKNKNKEMGALKREDQLGEWTSSKLRKKLEKGGKTMKKYKCGWCMKEHNSRIGLKYHLEKRHPNRKPLQVFT